MSVHENLDTRPVPGFGVNLLSSAILLTIKAIFLANHIVLYLKVIINNKTFYINLALFAALLLLSTTGCAFKFINRTKNLIYTGAKEENTNSTQRLHVFWPLHKKELKPVLIFVHGGNWNSGKKGLYSFLGSRLARKGIVAVLPGYPKSPLADYATMAEKIATAVKWTKENISRYGGDSSKIFISGHSAGGHLAALTTLDSQYFENLQMSDPVKGIVLIDAAGLDMFGYLKEENFPGGHTYLNTFTASPANWKKASPLYFLHGNMPPMLIYRGGKTYPSIIKSNEKFKDSLQASGAEFKYILQPNKRHVPMILQFFNVYNKRYDEIISFMKKEDNLK